MLKRVLVLLVMVMLPLTVVACGTEDEDGDGSGNNGANNGGSNNGGTNNGGTNNGGTNNGGGAASCTELGNCGGDLVGVHAFEEVCFTEVAQQISEECPEATLTITNVSFNGTLTVNADNTYSVEVTSTFTTDLVFPAACLPDGATAEMLCPALEEDSGLECVVEDGGCRCTGEDTEGDGAEEGTWSVEGGRVTLIQDDADEGNDPDQFDFCVVGDQTTFKPVPVPDNESDDDDFLMGFILRRQ